MARAKSRKKPTTDVAKQHAHYPYLHVGHGTSRCSDALSIWLIFGDAPGGAERAVIEEAMPEALRNQARSKDGTLRWCGPVLFVNSGMDFKYFVAGYDPNYLAWLDTSKPLPEADVQRVQREVMNADLSGPKQPKRSAWDAFNADIELWLAKAAATQPLKLVVKDVAVRDADATPWHRASAERAIAELDGLVALVRSLPPRETGSSQYSFVDPLLDAILQAVSVRDLAPQQREACIELLGRGGSVIRPRHLAALVGSYPAKERAGLVQALLRSHHVGVMGLFTAAPTRLLLLDDAVYATALEHAPHHPTPFFFWLRDKRMAPGPPEQTQWALRMLALIDKNGELAKEAAEEEVSGTNRFFRSNLRDLNELRAKLESAARAEALRRGAP